MFLVQVLLDVDIEEFKDHEEPLAAGAVNHIYQIHDVFVVELPQQPDLSQGRAGKPLVDVLYLYLFQCDQL